MGTIKLPSVSLKNYFAREPLGIREADHGTQVYAVTTCFVRISLHANLSLGTQQSRHPNHNKLVRDSKQLRSYTMNVP